LLLKLKLQLRRLSPKKKNKYSTKLKNCENYCCRSK
jgi:ribosomal protein S30